MFVAVKKKYFSLEQYLLGIFMLCLNYDSNLINIHFHLTDYQRKLLKGEFQLGTSLVYLPDPSVD
jgi:hypothetical protein